MKEWKPEQEFLKADFSYNQDKKISESKKEKEQSYSQDKQVTKWQPPKIENLKSKQRMINKTNLESKENVIIKKSFSDYSRQYLERTIQSSFYQSMDILRNWYWKKSETYEKKIYIILRSISKELLKNLILSMNSTEKKEFIKIYQKNYKVSNTEILIARKEFLDLLQSL